jgi:cyclin H
MADYGDSSQLNRWLFKSADELTACRAVANRKARDFLISSAGQPPKDETASTALLTSTSTSTSAAAAAAAPLPVEWTASGYHQRVVDGKKSLTNDNDDPSMGPWENDKGHAFLTPAEEAVLVTFYVTKLPSLIGPKAQVTRLRRESKVTATAALLLKRFYLSNSVMLHDPKTVMVAAAFLASKVEDVTADVRYLEEGTALMNAPVTQQEIIPAEIALLSGVHFDLQCFHPYRQVLALTEDLRTYVKSEKGKVLVQADRAISGQDLKPMYDAARQLLDQAALSDIPLLYSPGQVGMASLMQAQEIVQQQQDSPAEGGAATDAATTAAATAIQILRIDLTGYVKQRFEGQAQDWVHGTLQELCRLLAGLTAELETDMQTLKGVHKKLKKVCAWAKEKKKKRSLEKTNVDNDGAPDAKRIKT